MILIARLHLKEEVGKTTCEFVGRRVLWVYFGDVVISTPGERGDDFRAVERYRSLRSPINYAKGLLASLIEFEAAFGVR